MARLVFHSTRNRFGYNPPEAQQLGGSLGPAGCSTARAASSVFSPEEEGVELWPAFFLKNVFFY